MSELHYKMPKVDIVLVSYNTQNLLLKCLHSLFLTPQGIELGNVIIVDNASTDKTIENVKAYYPGCTIINLPVNIGYAAAVNEGMKRAKTKWVFVGNTDIEFRDFTLLYLIQEAEIHPQTAVCCPQQVFPNNSFQRSWGYFPGLSEALQLVTMSVVIDSFIQAIALKLGLHRTSYTVPYADGAGLLLNKEIFTSLGGFDIHFFFYTEECDYCYRAWQEQYAVLFAPSSILMHYRGSTTGGETPSLKSVEMLFDSKLKFMRKHGYQSTITPMLLLMIVYYMELMIIKCIPAILSRGIRNSWKTNLLSFLTCFSIVIQLFFPKKQ